MEFLRAIVNNDVEKVRLMIQNGVDVNGSFSWNSKHTFSPLIPANFVNQSELLSSIQTDQEYLCKPLNLAVIGGHANMVRLLLSAGADINSKDGRGRTAIVCAIFGFDLDASSINTSNLHLIATTNPSHFDIMKNILLCHPNLYYCTLDSPQYEIKGITPLCLASYLGKTAIIQLLLEDERVNVDGTDSKKATALMYAARDGNMPIVKMLLDYHASPDKTDSHGWSAIQFAEKNPEVMRLCEQNLRVKRSELAEPVHQGNMSYPINYSKLSHLLTTIPNYPSSLSHLHFNVLREIDPFDPSAAALVQMVQAALLQAIKIHDHLSLQTLLLQSPPLNHSHRGGPLLVNHHDVKNGLTAFHYAMRTKPLPSLDTITMLFQAGADINAQTYYGRTALHHLARFGLDKDGVTWGIQKGLQSKEGKTPAFPSHMMPSLVVRQGSTEGPHAPTAMDTANISTTVTETMMGVTNVPEHLATCASLLIQFGALVNLADPIGNTPLHFAAEFGGVSEVLEVLIVEGNADLHLKNKKGLTPLDTCKSEDLKRKMLQFEADRRTCQNTRSIQSSLNGTIRPFDSASEYNRSSLVFTSNHTMIHSAAFSLFADGKMHMTHIKQLLNHTIQRKKEDSTHEDYSDFDVILKAFFYYQTNFVDSVGSRLTIITQSISSSGGGGQLDEEKREVFWQKLKHITNKLKHELRDAHEMFAVTDQLVEKAMIEFREELEQVEQIHQSDWELSELQHDKIEKLFDVFERIDYRFCQLELAQDNLIDQVERLRKAAARKQQQFGFLEGSHEPAPVPDIGNCISHLLQGLLILKSIPIDRLPSLRDDRNSLCQDMTMVVEQVLKELGKSNDEHFKNASILLENRWLAVKDILTTEYPAEDEMKPIHNDMSRSSSQSTVSTWKKSKRTGLFSKETPSLNELELSFDILQSNLYEIQKDVEEINDHLEKLSETKKKMYELCLGLEKELNGPEEETKHKETQQELNQVLAFTQKVFDKQASLDKEKKQLLLEHDAIEKHLDATRESLRKVRPPALLQSLLERLDTDEAPYVHIEKDWKEDNKLVTEIIMQDHDSNAEDTDESCASSTTSLSTDLTALQIKQLNIQCESELSTLCYISRLDASLYCVKVLAGQMISKSRQQLIQVQVALGQASDELDEIRTHLTQLYDDAAEVARQVYALKTELERTVRHRKEEVIKVWEVADEVSRSFNPHLTQKHESHDSILSEQKEFTEEQERHQWIIRELEQLHHVHESLKCSTANLKHEQMMIEQNLKKLISQSIEPQVDHLVGQDNVSLLSVSDQLAELMDCIRENEVGLRSVSFWSTSHAISQLASESSNTTAITKLETSELGSQPSNKNSTLSSLSMASHRLSASTQNSRRSSYYTKSMIDTKNINRRLSAAIGIKAEKKRMSMISATSLSSLSSYQQEKMLAKATHLSSVLFKAQQRQVNK
ncbi:hypothetical protein BD560DRAFT_444982 [Blakeslea trispora]|nr:hypothetical protein BD560DRAFT_444982 [Blakeslea trispora]